MDFPMVRMATWAQWPGREHVVDKKESLGGGSRSSWWSAGASGPSRPSAPSSKRGRFMGAQVALSPDGGARGRTSRGPEMSGTS